VKREMSIPVRFIFQKQKNEKKEIETSRSRHPD
jgi:hypothetical protein